MQIRDFLDALQVEGSQDYLLATVLEGEQQGAALLLRGGVPVFGGSSLLTAHLPALQACTATGVLSVGGVPVFAELLWGRATAGGLRRRPMWPVAVVEMAKLLDLPSLRWRTAANTRTLCGPPGPTASVAAPLRRSWRRSPAVRRRISSSSPGPTPTIWIASRPSCKSLPPTWA